MITANATRLGNFIRLEIVHPDSKKPQITTVNTEADAMRIVYFANREYMLRKITGWLKQRMYTGDRMRSQEASKLLVLLGYYEHIPFPRLCKVIHHYRQVIESIAPGPKSKCFNYYIKTIVPLLNDAQEIGG